MSALPDTSLPPDAVAAARVRIASIARRTPLERSTALSQVTGSDIHLKLECWQPTRSFKVRGAANAIASLAPEALARGIATASAGNHGQAVALAAAAVDARATIFLPANAPAVKRERIRRLGAEIRDEWATYDDAEAAAVEHARQTGACFVHAFSDPGVIAGQGTIGLELIEDLPRLARVIVPVGGGGLVSGIGHVLRQLAPHVRVTGVQSVETPAMHAAFAAGRVVDVPVTPTLADGLAGRTDDSTFQRARSVVDEIVLVEEAEIAEAIRALFVDDGVIAEGSAATGVAALLAGRIVPEGPTAVIITGGNIDAAILTQILAGDDGNP